MRRIARMSMLADDASQFYRASQHWFERVGYIILLELSTPPTGNIKEPIIQRKVDIGDYWRNCLEALQQRRQQFGIGCLSRDLDNFANLPAAFSIIAFPVPQPNRRRQIF